MIKYCGDCKYSEICSLRTGTEFPTCTKTFQDWLKCRQTDYSMFEERERSEDSN